jgi:soluble lytic murein transglycosylase-like protein
MKFVATALLLGCAAIGTKFAVQSFFPLDNSSNRLNLPEIRCQLSNFWQPLATVTAAAASPQKAPPQSKPAPVRALPKSETLKLIRVAAAKHNVPAAFVSSIVQAESNFDCAAVSRRGAIGLMQLMPETAEQYGADPMNPAQNIDAGTAYLRVLMNHYGSLRRVIAAYNAGPGVVDRYRGIPPFRETRQYVARVLFFLRRFQIAERLGIFRG